MYWGSDGIYRITLLAIAKSLTASTASKAYTNTLLRQSFCYSPVVVLMDSSGK